MFHPGLFFIELASRGFFRQMNDEKFLKMFVRSKAGYWPNIKKPKTFNEKLSWLKIHDHNPLYTKLVDKIESKKYVESILGEGFTFPLIATYDCPEKIEFDKLPNECVIKCNHNSGCIVLCKDVANGVFVEGKSVDDRKMSMDEVKAFLKNGLRKNYFYNCREWAYKNVPPRILVEKFMHSSDGESLKDYKFFCFNGDPKYVWVGTNYAPQKFSIYSIDWCDQHVKYGYSEEMGNVEKPKNYEDMLAIVKKLCKGIPHVRIDLYNIDGKIYVGEFTFYTWAGAGKFDPPEWDMKFGELLNLDQFQS